ncbi:uncharacterized protein BDR25DRAFT_314732 [Lindgomyces ingoldianus]|uniref:Uncharacterized protein n=1 Tax=Lindgomyces ingoldianus TaxID=673940 RepID=A0ACB6QSH7_9PLEO|nr:uncharacterized protein BDR25DRAFT_314732 [Lindgomyces ingoldianus]KAF2469959.1 hypothetical protein BDR25DRAFT_314732 [Lindgomyces ingoldianus]
MHLPLNKYSLIILATNALTAVASPRNVTSSLLSWRPNWTVVDRCAPKFNLTTAKPTADPLDTVFHGYGTTDLEGLPIYDFREFLGDWVTSDAKLCSICEYKDTAFIPSRTLASYPPSWPEILLSVLSSGIAFLTADKFPLATSSLVVALSTVVIQFSAHAWTVWQLVRAPDATPWLTGDSWILLLVANFKIWHAAGVMITEQEWVTYGTAKPRLGLKTLRWASAGGMGLTLCIGIFTGGVAIVAVVKPELRLWRCAFDLVEEVPVGCTGLPPSLPSPYHDQAFRFFVAETSFSWVLLFVLAFVFCGMQRKRKGGGDGPLLSSAVAAALVMFGWFLVMKPIELALAIKHGKKGNIVKAFDNCCVVLPTLKYGGFIDRVGTLLAVFGRGFGGL